MLTCGIFYSNEHQSRFQTAKVGLEDQRRCSALTICTVIYSSADDESHYTYADVRRTAKEFGIGIASQWSWKKGNVLTVFANNCVDTPAVIWGCHWAGGVVSPANPAYTAKELALQLKESGAKALATQAHLLPVALDAASMAKLPTTRIILLGQGRDQSRRIQHFTELLGEDDGRRRIQMDPQKDLAFLVYSSGTTGLPKGVMLSHSNSVSNCVMLSSVEGIELSQNDKILSILPYYHIYGMIRLQSLLNSYRAHTSVRLAVSHTLANVSWNSNCGYASI